MRFFRYYRQVLSLAFWNAWGVSGFIGAAVAMLIPLMVWFNPQWTPERNQTMADLIWQVPLAILIVVLLIRLLLAPWWMHEGQATQIAEAEGRLTAKDTSYGAAVGKMTGEIADFQKSLDAAEIRRREEVEKIRLADPRRNAIRSELDGYIRRFEELKNVASNGGMLLMDEVHPLDGDVRKYLHTCVPEYRGYTGEFDIAGGWGNGMRISAAEVVRRCDDRIAKLREVQSWH